MKLIFGGVRGSQAVSGEMFADYGGATTSVLVEGARGELIIIDAGTGINSFNARLAESSAPALVLFSHYHLDHMSGLPGFAPIYKRDSRVIFAGPEVGPGKGVKNALSGLLGAPYWPIPIEAMEAELEYENFSLKDGSWAKKGDNAPLVFGSLAIRACPVAHPGGCLAWRVDEPTTGDALVFATDMEWAAMNKESQERFLTFCTTPGEIDLLVMDGHFAPEQYEKHRGWGHSTFAEVAEVGASVKARQVLLTHHAPENDDRELADHLRRLGNMSHVQRVPMGVSLARQGSEVELSAGRESNRDTGTGDGNGSDDSVSREAARNVLMMVDELHKLGYERLRISPGMSPSGLYWRCAVTHIGNILISNGAECLGHGHDNANYTSAAGTAYFDWDDALLDSPTELARKFVERFPVIARLGRGRDAAYKRWYQQVLELAQNDVFPVAYSDSQADTEALFMPVTAKTEIQLPWPPGGEAGNN